MSWFRLLRHDFQAGTLRRRYGCVPLLYMVGCFLFQIRLQESAGSWMDRLLFCFRGIPPLQNAGDFQLPIGWFVILAGGLYLQMDYLLNDLTEAGQQVIVRTVRRRGWFLSKCAWNAFTCAMMTALGLATTLVLSLLWGGSAAFTNTMDATMYVLGAFSEAPLTVMQTAWIGVILPYLTVTAISQLQMTLCLFCKPIISFLCCVSLLVISLLLSHPWIPGNGAQTIRSSLLGGMLEPGMLTVTTLALLVVSILAGMIRFQRMDLLRYED